MKFRKVGRKAARSRRAAVQLAGVAGGLVLAAAALAWLTSTAIRPIAIGGPFTLINGHGNVVSDKDFLGRYLLVSFGYTHCRDVCPATLTAIASALDKLGPAGSKVQPLFVTLDPERDTPAVMQHYVSAFGTRVIGLTGSANAIERMASEYRVVDMVHPLASGAMIDHSTVIYLIGPDGRYLAPLPADDAGEKLAARLTRYLL